MRGGLPRNLMGSMDGDAEIEIHRVVEASELALAAAFDAPIEPEHSSRGDGSPTHTLDQRFGTPLVTEFSW